MTWTSEHLQWLNDTGKRVSTVCGREVPVYEFAYDVSNSEIMGAWALHFRKHYSSDLDLLHLKLANQSMSEYMLNVRFPCDKNPPGPSIRAGDFAEILIADYLQYLEKYYVPRTRYDRKTIGNESTKGSDVLAFKMNGDAPKYYDELLVYEVKAKLTEKSPSNVLQSAIDHSSKDEVRLGESLNAIKQRLFDRGDQLGLVKVARFQNNVDQPYLLKYGAAVVVTETSFSVNELSKSDLTAHSNSEKTELLIITGKNLMALVHSLYSKAAHAT